MTLTCDRLAYDVSKYARLKQSSYDM